MRQRKSDVNPHAAALGRLGGEARAKTLSPERRRGIARLGYEARARNEQARAEAEAKAKGREVRRRVSERPARKGGTAA